MRVYLHHDMQLHGTTLTDTSLQVRYRVTADTAWLLAQLKHEHRAERIISSAARHMHVTHKQARHALYALLGFLDTAGGVRVHGLGDVQHILLRRTWRRRIAPSTRGFLGALVLAYGPLVIALSGCLYGIRVLDAIPAWWMAVPAAVFSSCVFHEAGHLYAVRMYKLRHILLAGFGYVAVMYQTPQRRAARCIAVAGPLAAVMPYVLTMCTVRHAGVVLLSLVVSAIHAASLLPWFSDGKTLWRNI